MSCAVCEAAQIRAKKEKPRFRCRWCGTPCWHIGDCCWLCDVAFISGSPKFSMQEVLRIQGHPEHTNCINSFKTTPNPQE